MTPTPAPTGYMGAVLASMAGALEGLDPAERARVRALLADIRRTVNAERDDR